ncbi:nicotianamine synthase 3 [Oryza sativa Japonica Group]|jgi:nicotianamine synthase|uniref:Nicotianamine synthase 3 n=6 Tax=Oryza TaxID=4527 RepID=NAS3_ORYSJ|nr:nicotianamine synthase 3 [Oryza sativa Japonica Group]XP_052161221.1 nicotianamine synthase 3 [Oryza glaberrima]A2YQ58.2 RecName: Full=Nicotianamine synthase 3; AltName: Full=S-adenosyl-L-methionine:S-adenosyl-L-methionine:S-adenosyl-methionine 3-amino-3-carboxypropyltransferase 3; Short=OsNAS3 [Oryza sativa Indica Group]Q0D3F2.1 RecName: Full=Nicotianamine synthase 3; AltName: Full=S-adenosyl-L-methionine:S-adenosyl-L-methionine:S-adenosyl-methionine 3-amino-3-carboxypropyltransferase 3; Sho|eukprot:NP_001060707.1 Os07g0689600 [Oryza sativa Japonica Group]
MTVEVEAVTMAKEEQPEEEEVIEKLVEKITGLAAAIGKLPSLSPSPEVNALFTELVMTCIPPSSVDVEQLGAEAQDMRGRLIRLCADAEGHLEAHYSDVLAAHDNPLDHLALFPYFNNYIQLAQLEYALLARHLPAAPPPSRLAFLGSGPLPLSSLVLAARHLPAASFHNYDICADANRRASRLVRADRDLSARMAFHTSDVAHVTTDLAAYDVVFLAALVGMAAEEKARMVEHLGKHMAPGAALVVRSAHGARGFLYPVVDPEEIRRGGFDVLAVHHPEGEVINSVIIARKPPVAAPALEGGDAHAHGHGAVVSRPCQRCEMEARAHQKMEDMSAMEKLPSS